MVGAFLACAMVLLGVAVARTTVRAGYLAGHDIGGLDEPPNILLVNSLTTLLLFCVFFGAGVYQRQKKEIHKRLMLLSMTILIFPAIGRLHERGRWVALPFIFAGLLYEGIFLRRLSYTFLWGAVLIFGQFAPSDCACRHVRVASVSGLVCFLTLGDKSEKRFHPPDAPAPE